MKKLKGTFLLLLALSIFVFSFAFARRRTHTPQSDDDNNPSQPLRAIPVRNKPLGADQADVQVILNHDRCRPGKFKFKRLSCDVLARGESELFDRSQENSKAYQWYSHNPLYEKGSVDHKTCFYLREDQPWGATPIPTNGYYTLQFDKLATGPCRTKNHWGERVPIKGQKECSVQPVPAFQLGLMGGSIPRSRYIDSLLMHPQGLFDYAKHPLWQDATGGCLKLPVDCIKKFYQAYNGGRLQPRPKLRMAIWEEK